MQNLFNFYRIKFIEKHNFNSSNAKIMTFETIYKTVIIMTDINDVLRELNALNSKENQNSIEKLMNMIETDRTVIKSFIVKNVFASSILSAISASVTSNKTIKFFIKTFKIMQLNNVKVVTANDVQRIINFNLYQFVAVVSFITMMTVNNADDSAQICVQTAQNVSAQTFNMIKLKNCYDCHQFDHRIKSCSKILKLMNDDFIHFNERRRMYFNKKEQKDAKMRLMYDLFKTKTARVCLQQQSKMQNTAMKINVINIVKKLFEFKNEIIDEEKIYDENTLMKIKVVR